MPGNNVEVKPTRADFERWIVSWLELEPDEQDEFDQFPEDSWFDILDDHRQYYEGMTHRLRTQLLEDPFWHELETRLKDADAIYASEHKYALLAHGVERLDIVRKPWTSTLDKCYRLDVVQNAEWPNVPNKLGRFVTPDNCLSHFPDVVRTTLVARYLDGVHRLREIAQEAAEVTNSPAPNVEYQARSEGYYALHIDVQRPLTPYPNSPSEVVPVTFEVQVCTQVQEVLRSLTHNYYEGTRLLDAARGPESQWDCHRNDFVPYSLGHVLHFADGMIMRGIRELEGSRR